MAKDNENEIATNDNTLIDGANDPSYMYSVNDVHNIAIALRKKYLNYEGKDEVLDGNNYSSLRENNNSILLLDPCNVVNINNHLQDELRKLIEGEQEVATWQDMPRTIKFGTRKV